MNKKVPRTIRNKTTGEIWKWWYGNTGKELWIINPLGKTVAIYLDKFNRLVPRFWKDEKSRIKYYIDNFLEDGSEDF